MITKQSRIFVVLSILALLLGLMPVAAQDRVEIIWFVGLGTGTNEEQIAAQEQVVADFNASQDEIELVIQIGADFETSRDTLSTLIAAGNSPDIIGPVGVGGSNAFSDQWLDLQPLVDSTGYDLSAFDPALVDLYRTEAGELQGIPFAVFPSIIYYNTDLFDEAGLEYPPSEFGAPYILDGEELPWNLDTLAEVAKIQTVDINGNDATMEGFDPDNIVQFGFNYQWNGIRLMWTHIQPETLYDVESNTVTIPDSWYAANEWIQNGLWVDHFMPNDTYINSELLNNGNTFPSGNVAMVQVPLWYTCCLADSVGTFEWNIGVVPMSSDGEYHVATDADTFRIGKGTDNAEASFTVLSYLLNEGVPTLAPTYGAFPARPEYQDTFIESLQERYPWDIDWSIAAESLAYNNPNPQHHEANFPNWQKGHNRLDAFRGLLFGDTGADVDIAAELAAVEADLQAIVEE